MPGRGEHLPADAVEARPGSVCSTERAPQLSGQKATASTPCSMLIFFVLSSQLFDTIRKDNPKDLAKVIPICGDITMEELGISEADQSLLRHTVSVVFHSAATVKFDEKLELSVKINMLGTKRLVELCHRMMVLEVS